MRKVLWIIFILLLMAGAALAVEKKKAMEIVSDWPEASVKAADDMIKKYGEPDGVTPSRLIWRDKAPWKEIIVYKEEIQHNFPMRHTDVLEQVIPYKVPPDKFDELAEYDGSVIVERTKGTIAARCDKEMANFLAINLAHDIVNGKKSVQEAREEYANIIQMAKKGEMHSYTRKLQFDPKKIEQTRDPDVAVIGK